MSVLHEIKDAINLKLRARRIWRGIKTRCFNKSNPSYARYGGRGITMCDSWKDSFERFLDDMGLPPANTSIERIDNNGGYFPINCKWATQKEQCRNRSSNRIVSFESSEACITDVNERKGFPRNLISNRIGRGWSVEDAVNRPVGKFGRPVRMLTIDGETMPLKDWCKRFGISKQTASTRLNRLAWTDKEAIFGKPKD